MKKTCAIFLFLIAPLGASGTVIRMRHPLSTVVDVSSYWNNEIWITMEKGDHDLSDKFYDKEDCYDATFLAHLDGSDVVIELTYLNETEKEGEVKGKAMYNKLCAFFNKCGCPFASLIIWDLEQKGERHAAYFRWTIAQKYIESVTID
jgi:hypothetical protein